MIIFHFQLASVTDWIQVILGLGTLTVAITALIQSSKIKTLTDVVEQLQRQADISSQMLEFEKKARILEVQPHFTAECKVLDANINIWVFKNQGKAASLVTIKPIHGTILPHNKSLRQEGNIQFFDLKCDSRTEQTIELGIQTLDHEIYIQEVRLKGRKFRAEFAQLRN